jgi:flagellar biosynthetic protein FlhB
MAEEQDEESKTAEPTEKRIADAVEKGNVPLAREAMLAGSLAAIIATLLLFGGWSVMRLTVTLRETLTTAGGITLEDREAAAIFLVRLAGDVALAVLPIMAVVAGGTVVTALIQNVPSMAEERITPRLSRISPFAGWKRLFGKAGLVEFAKAVLKLTAAAAILWFVLRRDISRFAAALTTEPGLLPSLLLELAVSTLLPLLGLALLIALGDLIWARLRWRNELRMTHHEVRQEMKEAEGDPLIKARIRTIARQRFSKRMLENLPRASMVITNPTHYAVALRYVREEGGAPVVVAKGVDHLALKIRELATEHDVPLVENRPLARGLYDQVDVEQQIPPEFYRAVAEIIHYLNSRGRLRRHGRDR